MILQPPEFYLDEIIASRFIYTYSLILYEYTWYYISLLHKSYNDDDENIMIMIWIRF